MHKLVVYVHIAVPNDIVAIADFPGTHQTLVIVEVTYIIVMSRHTLFVGMTYRITNT